MVPLARGNRYHSICSRRTYVEGCICLPILPSQLIFFFTVILQLRLYALYFLDKRVLAFMICTFLACLAASATLISIGLSHVKGQAPRFLPPNHRNNEFDTSPFKPWPMYSPDCRFAYLPTSPRTSIVGGYRFLSLKRFFAASRSTEGSKVILTEEIFSNRGKN